MCTCCSVLLILTVISLCLLCSCFVIIIILHGVRSGIIMASYRLLPPEPFDFKRPDEWQKWKRRFEQFREASGLSGEEDKKQINTLLYSMGEDTEDTLASISYYERKS